MDRMELRNGQVGLPGWRCANGVISGATLGVEEPQLANQEAGCCHQTAADLQPRTPAAGTSRTPRDRPVPPNMGPRKSSIADVPCSENINREKAATGKAPGIPTTIVPRVFTKKALLQLRTFDCETRSTILLLQGFLKARV